MYKKMLEKDTLVMKSRASMEKGDIDSESGHMKKENIIFYEKNFEAYAKNNTFNNYIVTCFRTCSLLH